MKSPIIGFSLIIGCISIHAGKGLPKSHSFYIGGSAHFGTSWSPEWNNIFKMSIQTDIRYFPIRGLYVKPYLRYDRIVYYQHITDANFSDFSGGAGIGYGPLFSKRIYPYVEACISYNRIIYHDDYIGTDVFDDIEFPFGTGFLLFVTDRVAVNVSIAYLKHISAQYDNVKMYWGIGFIL